MASSNFAIHHHRHQSSSAEQEEQAEEVASSPFHSQLAPVDLTELARAYTLWKQLDLEKLQADMSRKAHTLKQLSIDFRRAEAKFSEFNFNKEMIEILKSQNFVRHLKLKKNFHIIWKTKF